MFKLIGNYFLLGGSLKNKGGKVLGEYPDDLTSEGPLNIGRGRLIPTLSWDAIMNAVAEWTGIVDDDDLTQVLPNRGNFKTLFRRTDIFKDDLSRFSEIGEEFFDGTINIAENNVIVNDTEGCNGTNLGVSSIISKFLLLVSR